MSSRTPILLLRNGLPALPERLPRLRRTAIEEPPERRVFASYALTMFSVFLLSLVLNVVAIGHVQHALAQKRLYAEFRESLAAGSVPLGQTDVNNELVALGTPIARLTIASLGIDEIVVEGSTSWQTMDGVGHRRDSPLPGQPGVSILMGRAAAYGGVFNHVDQLRAGDTIAVLTAEGEATYEVIGPRTDTTMLPVLGASDGRLTLVTASGPPFRPTGVLRVDARLTTPAFGKPPAVLTGASLSESEQALNGDRSHAFALSWMLELLALMLVAGIWSWKRWSRSATWLVFAPVLLALGLSIATAVSGMLPNLL